MYQTRRTLEEAEDKITEDQTADVRAALDDLERLVRENDQPIELEALDEAAIQTKVKDVEEAMHGISAILYEVSPSSRWVRINPGDLRPRHPRTTALRSLKRSSEIVEDDED